MHSLLPTSGYRPLKRKVNTLVFVTANTGIAVLPRLLHHPDTNLKAIANCSKDVFQQRLVDGTNIAGLHWVENFRSDGGDDDLRIQTQAHKLAKWADVLVLVGDVNMISLMLSGLTPDVMLHVLRCWDVSRKIILLPEMSVAQCQNPMWEKQKNKLQRKWPWVQVLEPATFDFVAKEEGGGSSVRTNETDVDIRWNWESPSELVEIFTAETQTVLREARESALLPLNSRRSQCTKPSLPSEIWTAIFDQLNDWELATALDIYTHIPMPQQWRGLIPVPGTRTKSLEWIILTQGVDQVKAFFEHRAKDQQPPLTLSAISLNLIFRFARTDILTYLASSQKDVFWTSFPSTALPHKASCIYNSPAILQWWKDCPTIIQKEYDSQVMDGASRQGFIDVLQWWLDQEDLELRYTDRALENASSKGLVDVLEWWRTNSLKVASSERDLPLKVGKSIWLAAQCGRAQVISWWERSGIAYGHEERVATVASQGGHVEVLDLWYSLKGSKMIFDNQVLVGPTKHGHSAVLEWWKEASRKWGLRVEYKTCDIEEAMEDAVGGGGEGEVREWWARNGLNLGVGSLEWMKVKTLE